MRYKLKKFLKFEDGATLVEYGVALIVAIVVGGGALSTLAEGVGFNVDAACDVTVSVGAATNQTC